VVCQDRACDQPVVSQAVREEWVSLSLHHWRRVSALQRLAQEVAAAAQLLEGEAVLA
jgi:hypothetical protein